MRLPRDEDGISLTKRLEKLGYSITRQTGSHIRMTSFMNGEHHITIPAHKPLKIGILNSILVDVSGHFNLSKDELINKLW